MRFVWKLWLGGFVCWCLNAAVGRAEAVPLRADAPPLDAGGVELRDARGAIRRLEEWQNHRALVVVFLGVECPLSNLYAPALVSLARELEPLDTQLIGVDSNQQDTLGEINAFAQRHQLTFPIVKDVASRLADRLEAKRVTEAFVLDRRGIVRYSGRIDDQYGIGVRRAAPSRRDLAEAVAEVVKGRAVTTPVTEAAGCFISRNSRPAASGEVTYFRDVAPIFRAHCQNCHRHGQVAPFALATYDDALAWAETIGEVVEQRRMPPWHADPRYGRFANDPSMSDAERQTILRWIECGTPAGAPTDSPPPFDTKEDDEWAIGRPDASVGMPRPFQVPAEGVIEYQTFDLDPGFAEDRWIEAVEIRPGNRAVVHHATVYLKPPGGDDPVEQGTLGSFCLAATAPGTPPLVLPDGMAKRVSAGWHFLLLVHYVTVGSPQSDQTMIGLKLSDRQRVRKEVATRLLLDDTLRIPPGAANYRVERAVRCSDDLLLLSMFPHMHLRGKSFRYEAHFPDGRNEILLNVPRYDFDWQNRYDLAEPMRLPAGTVVRCVAEYDNSAANPRNPDASATVLAGPLSTDEMFNGYFDVALADQDLQAQYPDADRGRLRGAWITVLLVAAFAAVRRRFQGFRRTPH